MKFSMEHKTFHGQECIRFRAKIIKSEKHGIPYTAQKTWRVFSGDPMYSDKEIRKIGLAQAKRWQQKLLLRWFGAPEKIPVQATMIDECNDTSQQEKSMPSVQEGRLVLSGEVAGVVHEGSVQSGKDSGGQQHGLAAPADGEVGVHTPCSEIRAAEAEAEHNPTDGALPKADDAILPEGSSQQPERQ